MQIPLIVILLGIVGASCFIPAIHASFRDVDAIAQGFFYSGVMILVLTGMLAIATRNAKVAQKENSQLGALVAAYLVLPIAMTLPMIACLPQARWIDLWFEMLSCFTTTGASVFPAWALDPSLHLWRALMGWFGGFCILIAAYAILAPLNLGGHEVISGRIMGDIGGQAGRQGYWSVRLWASFKVFFPIYASLTLCLWGGLLMFGMSSLSALSYAMGVMSSSGISVEPSLRTAGASMGAEILLFVFMLFALSRRLMPLRQKLRDDEPWYKDGELRLGLSLIGVVVVVLLLRHGGLGHDESFAELIRAFWGTAFVSASFLTTTGYESQWWEKARLWSEIGSPELILLGLAMIGGGVATTAGGVTLLRVTALLSHTRYELERVVHPHLVPSGGAKARRLAREGAYMAWIFFMLFSLVLTFVLLLLSATGLSFDESLILSIAALSTTGPLASVAAAEPISWASQSDFVKVVLALTMVLGRIETLALIALLTPKNWGRRWIS